MFKITNLTDANKRIRLTALDSAMSNIDDSVGAIVVDGSGLSFCLSPKIVCTPTEEFSVHVLKTDYKENDVLRAAWRITDELGNVTIGSDTYTLSNYYDPTLNNPDWRYGWSPLALIAGVYDLQGSSIQSYVYGAEYEPWQMGCVGGISVMAGSLSGRGLTDFTSGEDMDVTVQVNIDGVDRSFTVQHPFLTAMEGDTEHHRLLMTKVSDQLKLLGFRTEITRGYLYQGPTGKYWGHHVSIFYDHGQFNSVSIGGNLIIGNGYTPRWDLVDFYEECELRKNGVNTPTDSDAVFRGVGEGEENQEGIPYVSEPRMLEFLPCADLGVALNPGEIDFIPTTDHPNGFIVNGCGYYAGG